MPYHKAVDERGFLRKHLKLWKGYKAGHKKTALFGVMGLFFMFIYHCASISGRNRFFPPRFYNSDSDQEYHIEEDGNESNITVNWIICSKTYNG